MHFPVRILLAAACCAFWSACDLTAQVGPGDGTAVPAEAVPDSKDGIPLSKGVGDGIFRTDLEDEGEDCWADRLSSGFTRTPCGHWSNIGPAETRLSVGGTSRSGRKALEVTYVGNESRGGATLSFSADVAHVRAYYNFAAGFDFGQGIKVGRIRSYNPVTQANDIDIIMTVRSSGDADQCGMTEMSDLGLFYNGKPAGHDWGHLIVPARFERDRWYAVEYRVALNTPGKADGSVSLWIDGTLKGTKTGLDIRGKAGKETRLNKIMLGGWYSNSALGNACADPSRPSTVFIDDVAEGPEFIGLD